MNQSLPIPRKNKLPSYFLYVGTNSTTVIVFLRAKFGSNSDFFKNCEQFLDLSF